MVEVVEFSGVAEFKRCRFPGCGGVAKKGRGKKVVFCSPSCRKEFYRAARQIGKMMLEGPFGCLLCRAIEIEKGRGVSHTPTVGVGLAPAQDVGAGSPRPTG